MPVPHHSDFTGRMPFLPPDQQRQSTESRETFLLAYLFISNTLVKIVDEQEI